MVKNSLTQLTIGIECKSKEGVRDMTVQPMKTRWVLTIVSMCVLCLMQAATVWASTRIGNAELQMWYRTRNTFHTDGGEHVDWVQWHNEAYSGSSTTNLSRTGGS